MGLEYVQYQSAYKTKVANVNVLVDSTTLADVLVPSSLNHTIYLQKVTLSITTHFATSIVQLQDESTGTVLLNHTDAAVAAGVPSVLTWDFGPEGRAIGEGARLGVTVINPGIIGRIHIEAYERLSSPTSLVDIFEPDDISALSLWFSADSGVFFDESGTIAALNTQTVKCWIDKQNGFRATEATTPPTLVTNAINGKPALVFDPATTKYLTGLPPIGTVTQNVTGVTQFVVALASAAGGATPRHIFTISNGTIATQNRQGISFGTSTDLTRSTIRRLDAGSLETFTSAAGFPIIEDVPFIFSTVTDYTAALASGYLNGAEAIAPAAIAAGAGLTSNTVSLRTRIGSGLAAVATQFWEGYIAEILLYRKALSAAERRQVEAYLSTKYNITVT